MRPDGNALFMDDANVPSLLSLPYLGFCEKADETYQRTRAMLLTPESNPWYFKGEAGESASGLWLCRTLVRNRL